MTYNGHWSFIFCLLDKLILVDELNCKQFMSKTYCFCYFSAQSAQCALRNGSNLNLWFRKDSFRICWLGGGGGCQSEQNYISLGSCLMVLSGQNTFILGNSPIVWQTCLLKREIPTSTFSSPLKQMIKPGQLFVHLILNFRVCENDIAMAIEAAKQYETEVIRK